MPIDDPRVLVIRQQHLTRSNPQKQPKRLKTELLPLETITPELQTRNLMLSLKVVGRELSQVLPKASRFDAWLVDGKLRGAFEDGMDSVSAITVIGPLLKQLGY